MVPAVRNELERVERADDPAGSKSKGIARSARRPSFLAVVVTPDAVPPTEVGLVVVPDLHPLPPGTTRELPGRQVEIS